jgi:hypothetical protein
MSYDRTQQHAGCCTIIRTFIVTTMSPVTWEEQGKETVTGPCNTPLFGDEERRAGVCRSCRKGWEVEGNRFADDVQRRLAADDHRQFYDPARVRAGDYLTLRYGNGTQLVYVDRVEVGRGGRKTLSIYRLVGTSYKGSRGRWTGPRPMPATDPRIICWTGVDHETPKPPTDGTFIPAR